MIQSAKKEFEKLITTYNININKLDEGFNHLDFTENGGITPLCFNYKNFKEDFGDNEEILKIGLLYTIVYADTNFEGKEIKNEKSNNTSK